MKIAYLFSIVSLTFYSAECATIGEVLADTGVGATIHADGKVDTVQSRELGSYYDDDDNYGSDDARRDGGDDDDDAEGGVPPSEHQDLLNDLQSPPRAPPSSGKKTPRRAAAASAAAARIQAVEGARVDAEAQRMQIYSNLEPHVIMGLAAKELAKNLTHIDHLTLSPDALAAHTRLLQTLDGLLRDG